MRADQLLLARGLAPSRSAAQRLIAAGALRWRRLPSLPWQTATKAGDNLPEVCEVDISDTAELRWVMISMLSRWTACIPMILRIATHFGAFFSFQTIGISVPRRDCMGPAAKLLSCERWAGTRMISCCSITKMPAPRTRCGR